MIDMRISSSQINGEITAIPSKSYAHRIAICNYLSGNQPLSCCGQFTSNDISVTEKCLKNLLAGESVLDCGESGSTLRFLLPLTASVGGQFEFVGHGKLMERPNEQLFAVLNEHGVSTQKDKTIKISGKLTSGEYLLRGDISSQYISGLLMALPSLEGDSRIVLTTPLCSAPYVDITIEVLKRFGVDIIRETNGFFVKGKAKFSGNILPEGDWSNASFFLALGAICGQVKVKGLNLNSVQGDRAILDVLTLAGANFSCQNDSVSVKKSKLKGFTFDAKDCPDIVPIACVIGAYASGKTVIKNIERLKIKESDRVQTTIEMLNAFGINATCEQNSLIVYGGKPKHSKIDSFNDHRIAMSCAVFASGVEQKGYSVITNSSAVNKSYPTFFEHLNLVGGKADEL